MKLSTEGDMWRELIVLSIIEQQMGVIGRGCINSDFSPLDFWIYRYGKLVGVVEIKCRQVESTKYKDIFLSERKYLSLMNANRKENVTPIFVVAFSDGKVYGYNVLKDIEPELTVVRRTKERKGGGIGANDIEPAYLIKVSDMVLIGTMTDEQLQKYKEYI